MTTEFAPLTDADEMASSHIADLGWTKIHYNEIGSGETVVLVHGGRLGATSWSNFVLNIAPLAQHFRVLAMDMPGFGKSAHHEGGPAGTTVNAKAIAGVLDQLGVERTHIIGNSMGGATSLTFMVDFPERTNKVIAMGPAPIGQQVWSTPRRGADMSGTGVVIDPTDPENWRKFYEAMVYDINQVPAEVLKKRMESLKDPYQDQHRLNRLARMQRGPGGSGMGDARRSIMEQLKDVETPVLLIQGRNDVIVPPESTLLLTGYLQNAEFHMFNKCGHWAQYEHADRWNDLAINFLLK